MTEDTLIVACAFCKKDIATVWTERGMKRGDHVLAGDLIFHPECWEEQVKRYDQVSKVTEPAPTREEVILAEYSTPGLKRNVLPTKESVTHTEPVQGELLGYVDCSTCKGLGYLTVFDEGDMASPPYKVKCCSCDGHGKENMDGSSYHAAG